MATNDRGGAHELTLEQLVALVRGVPPALLARGFARALEKLAAPIPELALVKGDGEAAVEGAIAAIRALPAPAQKVISRAILEVVSASAVEDDD